MLFVDINIKCKKVPLCFTKIYLYQKIKCTPYNEGATHSRSFGYYSRSMRCDDYSCM